MLLHAHIDRLTVRVLNQHPFPQEFFSWLPIPSFSCPHLESLYKEAVQLKTIVLGPTLLLIGVFLCLYVVPKFIIFCSLLVCIPLVF